MGAVVQFRAKDQKEAFSDTTLITAVMEAAEEGLAIIEHGRVLLANTSFAQIFGYLESTELQDRALADLVPESIFLLSTDHPAEPSAVHHTCEGVRKDGTEFPLILAAAACHTQQRELQVLSLQNGEPGKTPPQREALDAERYKLEAERLSALGRMVGGIAHDFNNLLTGIFLYCDLLLRGLDEGNPQRSYVQEIRKAGTHSAGLIRQLLSTARARREDAEFHSWQDVISGMGNFFSRTVGENIELVMLLDPHAGAVNLSSTAMGQIALNLLLNARDAMPQGGRITVSARNCSDCGDSPSELLSGYVEFSISDTGHGMDAATRAHLFEPFFTTKNQGNGLGLATTQRLVREANGSLEVESEPNQGTRVIVRLPKAPPDREPRETQNLD